MVAMVSGTVIIRRRVMAQTPPLMHYETVMADRGAVVAKVTASGTLSAIVSVQVGSQVSGRVQEILADFNSPVKKSARRG